MPAGAAAQARAQVPDRENRFVGSIGCKSSSCHGGAGPKRDQFITWTRQDFHARAYAVLINARSARIAETLGISAAAASTRCTVCHSPFQSVAPAQLSPTAHPDEGVSCESCHGAAGSWLRGHTRPDWTYQTRVAAGMRDLRNLYVRANACVACHQTIEPAMLGAGHPELLFELDGQAVSEPKHWIDSEPWNGPRAWLTGQAVALREMSWALAGAPPPEEEAVARWSALTWLMSKAAAVEPAWPQITWPLAAPGSAEFATARTQADLLARQAARSSWNESLVRRLLLALASTDAEFVETSEVPLRLLARRAERLVLALDRLSNALHKEKESKPVTAPALNLLFQDVQSLEHFDAKPFAGHLRDLRLALNPASR